MESFPLLVQWNSDPVMFYGFISVMDKEYEVLVEMGNNSSMGYDNISYKGKGSTQKVLTGNLGCIYGTRELQDVLAGHETRLQKKLENSIDMESFLIELVDAMEVILSSDKSESNRELPVSYWSHVVKQLDLLGWSRITYLSQDLSQVGIELSDASHRKHTLTVRFPPGYPAVSLILDPLEVPEYDSGRFSQEFGFEDTNSKEGPRLISMVQKVEKQLELLSDFWDVMQDIDEKTWVIDPEKPTRADCTRRCALGNHCSIQMVINPLSPRSKADTRLFGPSAIIEAMRSKLSQNLYLWDESKFPRENLEVILELSGGFPSPSNVTKDEMNIECGICYSFRYEGQIPDHHCSNPKCQRPFHRSCLYDWLRTVPTMRQSFNTLFGECPYCNKTITTTAPR